MMNDGVSGRVCLPTGVISYECEVWIKVGSLLTQQAKPGNGSGAPGFHHKGH